MPTLEPADHIPGKLQGFNYVLNKPDEVVYFENAITERMKKVGGK